MSVLLNELFYPKTDPSIATLIAAFSFCSVYVLRPIGALIFGYIGDVIGRKNAVIISTTLMAFSCVLMVVLPTYEQIGITAAFGITLCRALQGIAAQGEIIGTEIYLVETIAPPTRYTVVSLTSFFSALGGVAALGIYAILTFFSINWRFAFLFGAFIAVVGSAARTRLHETPEFVDMQKRCKKELKTTKNNSIEKVALLAGRKFLSKEKINLSTAWAYFFISCGFPVCFYCSFIHFGQHLKTNFNYTADAVLHHNLILSVCYVTSFLIYSLLCHKIYPLKMLKFRSYMFLPAVLLCPYLLNHVIDSPIQILLLQCFIMCFGVMDVPASGIFMSYFPIGKKFTSISLIYAFSRIIIYMITSFGLVFLTKYFGNYGIFFIMFIVAIGFTWGVYHFDQLENNNLKKHSNTINNATNSINIVSLPIRFFLE